MSRLERVSLALGAGGARGYAHIGAIRELEHRGIAIAGIAGSSMGALIGGIHAAGKLDEFEDWVRTLGQRDVLALLDVSLTAPGVVRAERLLERVRRIVGDARIEQLPIPFTAVATDLRARREVWFQRGPLIPAIRASIALPGVFPPIVINGQLLADGGLMDPVPVAATAATPADATIAVSLGGERQNAAPARRSADPGPLEGWVDRFRRGAAAALDSDIVRSLAQRRAATVPDGDPEGLEALPAGLTRFDVMSQSIEAMQAIVTRFRMAGFPPDILVTVPRDACGTLEFHRAEAMIELGRELTARKLDEYASPDPRGAG